MPNANQPSERTSHPKGIPDAGPSESDAMPNEERIVREGEDGQTRVAGGHVQNSEAAYDSHRDGGTRTSRSDGRSGINDDKPNRRNDTGELADRD